MALTQEQRHLLQLESRLQGHQYTDATRLRLIRLEAGLEDTGLYAFKVREAAKDPQARDLFPDLFDESGKTLASLGVSPHGEHQRRIRAALDTAMRFQAPGDAGGAG